jgi:biopolymer transport protein ExbB
VLKATLEHLDSDRDHLEDVISESILHETPFLDRFGSTILVLAAVAPLLGLLGTVTGMISTFDVITEFGTGNPKLLSGGISEALVTTELGLIVAIPALLAGNLLGGWAEGIKDAIDKSALRLTNIAAGIRVSMRPPPANQPEPDAQLVEA